MSGLPVQAFAVMLNRLLLGSLIYFRCRYPKTLIEGFRHAICAPATRNLLAIDVDMYRVLVRLDVKAGHHFNRTALVRFRLDVARAGLSLNPCHDGLLGHVGEILA